MDAQFVTSERRGEVAWITFQDWEETLRGAGPDTIDVHSAIGMALHEARYDADVRLVVLTGGQDGTFYSIPSAEHYAVQENRDRVNPLKRPIGTHARVHPDALEVLALMEKPVVARVNGDVIGFGQSILWGCDLIVAREDAVVADVHTGQGDVVDSKGVHIGFPQAITPGDGAMAFFPLYLPPPKLKEYMFLSKCYTAKELEALHVINYAVPAAELDAVVDDLVTRLLARPSSVLARTKRVCNKQLVNQLNLAKDLAAAYEVLDLWEHAKDGTM
jgi:enoyl-CoA hydratase